MSTADATMHMIDDAVVDDSPNNPKRKGNGDSSGNRALVISSGHTRPSSQDWNPARQSQIRQQGVYSLAGG